MTPLAACPEPRQNVRAEGAGGLASRSPVGRDVEVWLCASPKPLAPLRWW